MLKYVRHMHMCLKLPLLTPTRNSMWYLSYDKYQQSLIQVTNTQTQIRSRICQRHDFVRNHLHHRCCNSSHLGEMLSC